MFADIDGDADDDAFLGEANGGIDFWYRIGSCCQGTTGNVDADTLGTVDVNDIITLVDWEFGSLPSLPCPKAANVNGDAEGVIDLTDLIYLVNFVFLGGASPAACQ